MRVLVIDSIVISRWTRRVAVAAFTALSLSACNSGGESTSSGGGGDAPPLVPLSLNAFTDFNCTSNWTNRDGGLGLVAGTRNGTCKAAFPGTAGRYRLLVKIQTEFDGSSPYRVAINGRTIHTGRYPYSTGRLVCDCPDWRKNCPDRIVSVDTGVHDLKPGDVLEFYGEEEYPCGKHGSYAKWQGMDLRP